MKSLITKELTSNELEVLREEWCLEDETIVKGFRVTHEELQSGGWDELIYFQHKDGSYSIDVENQGVVSHDLTKVMAFIQDLMED